MTPEELRKLLRQNEYFVLEIPPEDFVELEKELVNKE